MAFYATALGAVETRFSVRRVATLRVGGLEPRIGIGGVRWHPRGRAAAVMTPVVRRLLARVFRRALGYASCGTATHTPATAAAAARAALAAIAA